MLSRHLKMAPRIYSRLKIGRGSREPIIDILKRWDKLSRYNIDFLKSVDFTLVAIPEALSVEQLDSIFHDLSRFGFKVSELIINNVIKEPDSKFLITKAEQQKKYLELIKGKYSHLQIIELPLFPYEMKGLERLQEAEKILFAGSLNTDIASSAFVQDIY